MVLHFHSSPSSSRRNQFFAEQNNNQTTVAFYWCNFHHSRRHFQITIHLCNSLHQPWKSTCVHYCYFLCFSLSVTLSSVIISVTCPSRLRSVGLSITVFLAITAPGSVSHSQRTLQETNFDFVTRTRFVVNTNVAPTVLKQTLQSLLVSNCFDLVTKI